MLYDIAAASLPVPRGHRPKPAGCTELRTSACETQTS
jgi:hypothetical protein